MPPAVGTVVFENRYEMMCKWKADMEKAITCGRASAHLRQQLRPGLRHERKVSVLLIEQIVPLCRNAPGIFATVPGERHSNAMAR